MGVCSRCHEKYMKVLARIEALEAENANLRAENEAMRGRELIAEWWEVRPEGEAPLKFQRLEQAGPWMRVRGYQGPLIHVRRYKVVR